MEENKKEEYTREDRIANINYGKQYVAYGGMIPFMMKTVEGMREFIYDQLFVKCNTADVILSEMKLKFPDLEKYPSVYTVTEFKKKMIAGEKDTSNITALAMKDEARNMQAFGNLNLVEEEAKLYNKSKNLLNMVETVMVRAYKAVENMSMPPDFFWKAVEGYQKVLEFRGSRLKKLDELAVRYGFAPPDKVDPKLIFQQQNIQNNITINSEVEDIIKQLDIKNEEDLYDDEFFNDKLKQSAKIISHSGQPIQEEAEIVEGEG